MQFLGNYNLALVIIDIKSFMQIIYKDMYHLAFILYTKIRAI